MLELQIQNNQIVITSLLVADLFERAHYNVLATIRSLRKDIEDIYARTEKLGRSNSSILFVDSTYELRGISLPCVFMNRNGFLLLVASFTGKVSLEVKLNIIDAFDKYEKNLHQLEILKNRENDMIALGVNEGIAKLASFEQTSLEFGADFRLPTYKEPDNLLNPTQISLILWNEKHPRLINRILEEMNFQENIGGKWIAKGNGILYSERIPFNHNGHAELQLRWKSSIIEVIRPFLEKNDVEKSISPPKNDEEMLTVTQIAKILELPASEINQILRQMKLQRRFRKIWIPIGDGLRYIGTNRKWKTSILELIRSFLQERKDE